MQCWLSWDFLDSFEMHQPSASIVSITQLLQIKSVIVFVFSFEHKIDLDSIRPLTH